MEPISRYLIPLLALAFAASPLLTGSFSGFDPNAFPGPPSGSTPSISGQSN